MIEIRFETHALTVDNERGLATGWNGGELSGEKLLAGELRERHRARLPAIVFTSDLARAVETVDIAFGGTDVPVRRDTRLRECDYGRTHGNAGRVLGRRTSSKTHHAFSGRRKLFGCR